MKGRVSLSRENNGGAGLANDPRRAMVREGGFRACDDLLPLIGKQDNQVVLLPLAGGFIEAAQGVKIVPRASGSC